MGTDGLDMNGAWGTEYERSTPLLITSPRGSRTERVHEKLLVPPLASPGMPRQTIAEITAGAALIAFWWLVWPPGILLVVTAVAIAYSWRSR